MARARPNGRPGESDFKIFCRMETDLLQIEKRSRRKMVSGKLGKQELAPNHSLLSRCQRRTPRRMLILATHIKKERTGYRAARCPRQKVSTMIIRTPKIIPDGLPEVVAVTQRSRAADAHEARVHSVYLGGAVMLAFATEFFLERVDDLDAF